MIQGRRKAYATDSFPNAFTYQVDLFIDVDDALVNKHDTDTVNFPNTIMYVNALITAISSIYEREVDTRLNVLHIQKTSIYNNAADSEAAIDIMWNNYSGDTWHYTDSNGHQPDLHHGILYKNLQGGENIIFFTLVLKESKGQYLLTCFLFKASRSSNQYVIRGMALVLVEA